ncbi:sensor histidine kinase [Nonomuraea jabiensis]|uniref:sensor histidine kinase n=1 Tax=Nonomuraea jabiensis TaxID=882448 RepID=UPI0036CF372A
MSGVEASAASRIEWTRAVTMIALRLGALVLCGSLELLDRPRWAEVWPLPVVVAALLLSSLGICVLAGVRGVLPSRALLAADFALVVVACPVIPWCARELGAGRWPTSVLPYVLLTAVMIGISFPAYPVVIAWTAALGGAFLLGQALGTDQPWWTALPHVAGMGANAAMAAYVARVLTRNARDLDEARAEEVLRTAQLSEERERARTARVLHDRILQTLEALVRDGWIGDESVRARVAEESRWLRAYLRGDDGGPDGDVLAALEAVVRQAVGRGLHVEFNASRLRASPDRDRIPGEIVDALAGALREALTNVVKHADVEHAVVWAEVQAGVVTLSVLDHGRGFDMGERPDGLGISRSIIERVASVGGTASVEAAPGEGTHVSVRIPLPG